MATGSTALSGHNDGSVEDILKTVLVDTLGVDPDIADALEADSLLFGALPELDSMAVATLLTELEDRLGIIIEDDDVDGETFETFGSFTAFAERKLDERR